MDARVSDEFVAAATRLFAAVRSQQNEAGRREGLRTEGWFDARVGELVADLEAKVAAASSDPSQKRTILLTKRAFLTCVKDCMKTLVAPEVHSLLRDLDTLENSLFLEMSELVLDLSSRATPQLDREESDLVRMDSEFYLPQRSLSRSQSAAFEIVGLKARVGALQDELATVTMEKEEVEKRLKAELDAALNSQKAMRVEMMAYQKLLQRERERASEQEALMEEREELKSRLSSLIREKTRASCPLDGHRTEDRRFYSQHQSRERLRSSAQTTIRASAEGKVMSLRHVLLTIAEVYASKEKSDTRNRESRQPTETMSQHLHTFLNTKYGLKVHSTQSLRERSTLSLYSAIAVFSHEDCDVALFSKVLRSEVEESYRHEHEAFKLRIFAALRDAETAQIRSRRRVDESLPSEKPLTHLSLGEAQHVVSSLFVREDQEVLRSVLQDYILQCGRGDAIMGRRAPREKIAVEALVNVLLRYRLQQHEESIAPFVREFQQADGDADGRLTQVCAT